MKLSSLIQFQNKMTENIEALERETGATVLEKKLIFQVPTIELIRIARDNKCLCLHSHTGPDGGHWLALTTYSDCVTIFSNTE